MSDQVGSQNVGFLITPLILFQFQTPNSVVRFFIDPSNSQDIRDWFQVDAVLGIVSLRQDMRDYYFNNNTQFSVQVMNMKILQECKILIEKSVPRVTVSHH